MELLMSEARFNKAENWFENLREEIVDIIHKIDGKEFNISDWAHKSGGGGKMSKIKGNIIEKGTHDELLKNSKVYENLYKKQVY